MKCDDLTPAQARALKSKLQPWLGYLTRLKRRMVNRGFPADDKLLNAAVDAENAMHQLCVEVHYTAINASMAEPKQPAPDPLFTRKSNLRKHEGG